jgi:putative flippase GtrA
VIGLAQSFRELPQFARFLMCGGMAAGVNWASRFLWSLLLPFGAAVAAAYATGMAVAFCLFRLAVFQGSDLELASQAHRFVLVNLVGMAVTWSLANLFVFWALPGLGMTAHVEATGHALAIVAPVATSWFGHRRLTFR